MNERAKKVLVKTVALSYCLAWGAISPVAAQPPLVSARVSLQARLSQNVDFPARVVAPADFFEPLAHALKTPIVFPLEGETSSTDEMKIKRSISAAEALKTLVAPSYGVAVMGGVMTSLPLEKLAAFSAPLMNEKTRLAGLEFVNSLSEEQVKKMYAEGPFKTTELSPEQSQIFIEFIEVAGLHKWGAVAKQFPAEVWPPTPEQWRASPLNFDLAYTLSFTFVQPNSQETGNVDLWDMGRGWARELPVSEPATPTEKQAAAAPTAWWHSAAQVTPSLKPREGIAPNPVWTLEKTQVWSAAELGAKMQLLSGREQLWSANEKFKKTRFLLTDGDYPLKSLERIIALYTGDSENARADTFAGEFQESDELFFVGETAARLKEARRDRVRAVAAQAKAKLRRLPDLSGLFDQKAFEKHQDLPFVKMTPLQQALIRDSAKNSGWVDTKKLELEKSRVILFEAISLHIFSPNGSSGYQIW